MNERTRRCPRATRASLPLDRQFDRLFPDELRHLSSTHWTPVSAAVRAASLLCATKNTRVLDVGAGVGKVCAIGALSGEGMWVGVEHHAPLVRTAEDLARSLGVSKRTTFLQADAFSIDWNEFDALYFYNPFELQLFGGSGATDPSEIQIARVQQRLAALPSCTRVLTLHGFGGAMPGSFELLYHEVMPGVGLELAMWIQRASRTVVGLAS